tara:strand:+ start:404 stop:646 length:243 start_codon:yes stop_codon:yes gene_type:complete
MMPTNYAYDKTWKDIEEMLEYAEVEKNKHKVAISNKDTSMKRKAQHMRDYKGLQGVCYALRWTLGDKDIRSQVVLGRESQ